MARQRREKELASKAQINRFIHFYTSSAAYEDLERAARLARMDQRVAARIFKEGGVREEIERKLHLLEVEQAKLEANARKLTVGVLDGALFEEIHSKKNGHVRVRAIELGYRRTGLIRDGEFYVAPDPTANKNAPSIYQARQMTVRRTVTEEVTQTDTIAAPEPTPALPEHTVQILEY